MSKWYVYLAGCADGTLYAGISKDLEKRMKDHNTGKGSKYIVKSRRPVTLLASVEAESRSAATSIESVIKSRLNRKQKLLYFGLKEWPPKEEP